MSKEQEVRTISFQEDLDKLPHKDKCDFCSGNLISQHHRYKLSLAVEGQPTVIELGIPGFTCQSCDSKLHDPDLTIIVLDEFLQKLKDWRQKYDIAPSLTADRLDPDQQLINPVKPWYQT